MHSSIMMLFPLALTLGTHPPRSATALSVEMGPRIPIAEDAATEFRPAVAYNSNHDEYLVVWQDTNDVLYARRVLPLGQLSAPFAVSTSANGGQAPAVAYDPVRDRYLVTFVYDYWGNGSDLDIRGRFIPWDGPSSGLTDFTICDWTTNQGRPALAFAGPQDEYLAVWANSATPTVPSYISGQRIWANGSGFPATNPFLISSGPEDRGFPDVAHNRTRNEYLVTWDANIGGGNIYGVRLSGTGSILGSGEFVIAGWPSNEQRPSVAACHRADQYLVAWQSDQETGGSDWAIYGRYVNGSGVPGNVYEVDDTTAPQIEPEVSCDAGGQQYFLAWQDMFASGWYAVTGRTAFPDETMELSVIIEQPGASHHRREPAIGGGAGHFLTAWEHEAGFVAYSDIEGRLARPDLLFRDGFQ